MPAAPVTCVKATGARVGSTSPMAPNPLQLTPGQRATLAEFERLHERWRAATEAAGTWQCGVPADEVAAQSMLRHTLEADEACRLAMKLLRDQPL